MILGARTGAWAKSGYTAKDYVQDGLVFMLDGIENAGWGVHDPNATVWRDLVGNKDFTLFGSAHFDEMSMRTLNQLGYAYYNGTIFGRTNTIELSISGVNYSNYNTILTRSDDNFSVFTESFRRWAIKGPSTRPNCTPVYIKPLILTWDSSSSKISYADGTGTSLEGSSYNGGGNAKWSICGSDLQHQFVGNVYAVRIYNRILNDSELAANYAVDKARFNLP